MEDHNENLLRIEFLYNALEDTQNTIRATDNKAGLLLVGLTIISTFLSKFCGKLIPLITQPLNFIILVTIILGIITLISFIFSAFITFKSINPLSSPVNHVNQPGFNITVPFYLFSISPKMGWKDFLFELGNSKLNYNIEELCRNYSNATIDDIINALTFELAKVSYTKEKKIFRVSKAITIFEIGVIAWLITGVLFKCII